MAIFRGDIFFVKLGPTQGKELDAKARPVVVLSSNDINNKPLVVTVIPGGTPKNQRTFQTEVRVEPTEANGLAQTTIFQCFQIKALDHGRFSSTRVGVMAAEDLQEIEQAVKRCLGLL